MMRFTLCPICFAAENWAIDDFQSNIKIRKSGEVSIDETIKVDFPRYIW
jgi:hypothetical protein